MIFIVLFRCNSRALKIALQTKAKNQEQQRTRARTEAPLGILAGCSVGISDEDAGGTRERVAKSHNMPRTMFPFAALAEHNILTDQVACFLFYKKYQIFII